MHENPSSWQTTLWCPHSCVIWVILQQTAGNFQSLIQFGLTQIASYKGPSYYQAVLLGVSAWRIFPPQAYTIMLLQCYNSQRDSPYTAYLHLFSRNRWKDAHRLDKLNSSTKTTGILHFILSKLIIQRCWAPAFLTNSSGAAAWVHSKDIYHWYNKEDIIWVMTWRGLILQDAKCFPWFESDSCVAMRSVNTTIHTPSLPCHPLCDVCSPGLFLTLECKVFGVKTTSFYTFV